MKTYQLEYKQMNPNTVNRIEFHQYELPRLYCNDYGAELGKNVAIVELTSHFKSELKLAHTSQFQFLDSLKIGGIMNTLLTRWRKLWI